MRKYIDTVCLEIADVSHGVFPCEGDNCLWINPNREQLELIAEVIGGFVSLGYGEITIRHQTRNWRHIGDHLRNRDFESWDRSWNERISLDRFSDITFNPSNEQLTIAGFCRNCCYCLILPYIRLVNPFTEKDVIIWENLISSLGGKTGWVYGTPLLLHKWDTPSLEVVKKLQRSIQEIKNKFNLCKDLDEALNLLNKISDRARRY